MIKQFKIGDFLITAIILISALAMIFIPKTQSDEIYVEVTTGETLISRHLLTETTDETIEISNNEIDALIKIQNGTAFFHDATCFDQVCVHTGKLEDAGDVAICLPSQTIVRLVGTLESEVDIVAK